MALVRMSRKRRWVLGGGVIGPGGVPDLALWVDLSDISTLYQDAARTTPVTTNGQSIKGVTDKSGNGNHLDVTGSISPTYVTGSINGLSAADLAGGGGDDQLSRATLTQGSLAQPLTEFIVVDMDVTILQQLTDSFSAAGNRCSIFIDADGTVNFYAGVIADTADPIGTDPHIITAQYNGASSECWPTDGGAGTTANVSTQGRTGIRLGLENAGVGNPMNGRIGEYLLYNKALTLPQINTIGNYLGTKWGLTWSTAT